MKNLEIEVGIINLKSLYRAKGCCMESVLGFSVQGIVILILNTESKIQVL